MNLIELDYYLKRIEEVEQKHKNGFPSQFDKNPIVHYKQRKIYSFNINLPNQIVFSKNARFDKVPLHIHDYIEINYMYSGTCEQIIDDKKHILHQGQMTFIDTKTPHAIGYTDENDIMVNFLISKDYLNNSFLSQLTDHNLITSFFINSINNHSTQLNYLILNTQNNERLKNFIYEFIWEHYHPSLNSREMKNSLFLLIILEMINTLDMSIAYESISKSNSVVFETIEYLENNFLTCTLETTAHHIGINPCYLTTLLKKHFHKSYKEIIIELRMNYAVKLLLNSHESIDDIARQSGYQNLSFFYKKFKEIYHCSPKEYRSHHKQ